MAWEDYSDNKEGQSMVISLMMIVMILQACVLAIYILTCILANGVG